MEMVLLTPPIDEPFRATGKLQNNGIIHHFDHIERNLFLIHHELTCDAITAEAEGAQIAKYDGIRGLVDGANENLLPTSLIKSFSPE